MKRESSLEITGLYSILDSGKCPLEKGKKKKKETRSDWFRLIISLLLLFLYHIPPIHLHFNSMQSTIRSNLFISNLIDCQTINSLACVYVKDVLPATLSKLQIQAKHLQCSR